MEILDQTGDLSGRDTYQIMRRLSPPQFVKQASREELHGPEELMPPAAYADPGRRRFPVHTKAATWLSTAFFLKNADKIDGKVRPWIEGTLKKMSSFFKISKEVDLLKKAFDSENSAGSLDLPDDVFALIVDYPDGSQERRYPLRNAKEVRAAADWLRQYRSKLPFEDRYVVANKILEKAAKYGADLGPHDEFLEKQAGRGGCDVSDVVGLIWNRVRVIGDMRSPAPMQVELAKMAQICLDKPEQARGEESLVKIAGIIDQVDRMYKVAHSEVIPRPEDVLFQYTKKQASEFLSNHCKTTTGHVYKVADFRRLKLNDVKDLLGDDFASEVSKDGFSVSPEKMAEVASTLPRNDAAMLDRLLENVGILPYSKEASCRTGVTKSDLREVARLRNT